MPTLLRPIASPLRPRPLWDRLYLPPVMSDVETVFDFRAGVPDAARFPFATWRALLAEQMRPGAVGAGAHIDAAGLYALRTAIARHVGVSRAVRAVGTAVGRNPVSFLIPCHRALRGTGALGGYHWGLPVKRAMLAWESARAEGPAGGAAEGARAA